MIIKNFKLFESGLNQDIIQDVKDICLEIVDLGYKIKYVHESEELVEHYKIIIGEEIITHEEYDDYDNLIDYDDDEYKSGEIVEGDILFNSPVMMDFYKRLYQYLTDNNYYLRIKIDGECTLIEAGYFSEDLINRYKLPFGSDNFNEFKNLEIIFWPKNVNERLNPSTYYNAGVKLKAKQHIERGDNLIRRSIELDNKNTLDFTIVADGVHDIKARFSHFNIFLINDDIESEFRSWQKGDSHNGENAIKIYVEPIFINLDSEVKSKKFCPFILTFMIFGEYKKNKDLEELLNFEIKIESNIDFSKDSPIISEWGYGVITDRKSAVKLRNIILGIKSNSEFLDYAEEIISDNAHLDLDTYEKFLANIDKIRVNNLYIPYEAEWDDYIIGNDITK